MGQNIHVLNSDHNIFEVENFTKKVFFVNITDVTRDYQDISVKIDLPPGFKLITKTNPTSLSKGTEHQFFFALQNNDIAQSAIYEFGIHLVEKNKVTASTKASLKLLKYSNIEIFNVNKPEYIDAAVKKELSYLIKNNGNSKETIWLRSKSGDIQGERNFQLGIGESKTVIVSNTLPTHTKGVRNISFDLSAYVGQDPIPTTSTFNVPYLINSTKRNDAYLRFPINASILYNQFSASTKKTGQVSFDINGKGYLDDKKKHELEFIARGPNNYKLTSYGLTDQYLVRYNTDKFKIELGDQSFNLSQLTENSRFARGINVSQKFGQMELKAFYLEPRFYARIKKEYGLSLTKEFNPSYSLSTLFLRKDHIFYKDLLTTDFYNLKSKVTKQNFVLETEGSISVTDGSISYAFRNSGYIKIKRLTLNSTFLQSAKDYNGYYSDGYLTSNAINYRVSRKLNIGFNQSINQSNPSLDSILFTTSPYSNSNTALIYYNINKNNSLNLSGMISEREDRQDIKSYHFKENKVRLRYKTSISNFDLRLDGDLGETQNLLLTTDKGKASSTLYRGGLGVNYKTKKSLSLGVFGEYLNTSKYQTNTNQETQFIYYGGNVNYSFRNYINFRLNYRNNYNLEELYTSRDLLNANLIFNFKNQSLALTGIYSLNAAYSFNKNLLISAKYTIRLNAPLKKKRDLGRLIGQVHGEKKEGVIFNFNGQKVVTDRNGEFKLNDVEAGVYNLALDKSSMGLENTIDTKWPLMVEVLPDTTKRLVMKSIKTGQISGSIVLNDENTKKISLENVLIELYNDHFSKLTTTDKKGSFNFAQLKEEDYSIRIISKQLSKSFSIKNEKSTIAVRVGENTLYTFQLAEKKKNIRFQDGIIVLSEL
ncbi:hypothetical protein DJ013_04085 [Arcticibacterium luteifluviistationis]|uniref:Uncharacterized protein n=1 Tax=Arcticibacterium luteifluviistationis TaxID=1784714 RepID=A0A2Z4G896_9BACT|nr:hypothetical protein DJ013_04085 [Arcticibacterium luteifluviistationis]